MGTRKCEGREDRPSSQDGSTIYNVFKNKMNFEVSIHYDLPVYEMQKKLLEDHTSDHSKDIEPKECTRYESFDCIAIFILGYGTEQHLLDVKGKEFDLDAQLLAPLKKCPSLVGKPKIVFVDADLGDKEDKGILVQVEADGNENKRIAIEADLLYAYSTVEGYKSLREDNKSVYVDKLCKVLKDYHNKKEITEMLVMVNNLVSKATIKDSKQIPHFKSTLTKELYFF